MNRLEAVSEGLYDDEEPPRARMSMVVPRMREAPTGLGTVRGLVATGLRAVETVAMHVVRLEAPHRRAFPAMPAMPSDVECRVLDTCEVLEATLDPDLDMEPTFAPRAVAKGDKCVGVFVDGQLASYGWYASTPTEVVFGLHVAWDAPETLYMYKGFTRRADRGRGLYGLGLMAAMRLLAALGGAFSFVRRDNIASLGAAARAGYTVDGALVASRRFGTRGLLTGAARHRGIRLTRAPR